METIMARTGEPNPPNPWLDQLRRVDDLLAAHPNDAVLWKTKARMAHHLGDVDAASQAFTRALELDPGDAQILLTLAIMDMMERGGPAEVSLSLFRRCQQLDPRLAEAFYWAAYACLLMGDYSEAARCLARAVELEPGAANYRFLLGWSLGRGGDRRGSGEAFAAMSDMCMSMFNRTHDMTYLGHLIHALLYGGYSSEAKRLLPHFTDRDAGRGPSFHHPEYLPDTPTRIRLLRRLVRGRDLAILAYGPSLAGFEREIGRLADLDVCYFTFGYSVIDDTILSKIGKGSDLFCVTGPPVIKAQLPWLMQYLSRPQPNMLLTHGFAMEGANAGGVGRAFMEKRFAERLLYFRSMQRHPPVPSDPLHFPPYNTLSVVLPMALMGQPRRIFLFGCDGHIPPPDKNGDVSLFHSSDFQKSCLKDNGQYHNPLAASAEQKALNYSRMLHLETHTFNFQTPVNLAWLSHIHRTEIPPIYNCSPTSAYEGFPKITCERALAMLEGRDLATPALGDPRTLVAGCDCLAAG